MSESGRTLAMHSVLENGAHEVSILARKAYAIDEAMGDAICAVDAMEALPLELTQDVDLMRQSADCVNILLNNLAKITSDAPQPPEFLDADALTKGVYLSSIRNRVTAAPVVSKAVHAEQGEWIDL